MRPAVKRTAGRARWLRRPPTPADGPTPAASSQRSPTSSERPQAATEPSRQTTARVSQLPTMVKSSGDSDTRTRTDVVRDRTGDDRRVPRDSLTATAAAPTIGLTTRHARTARSGSSRGPTTTRSRLLQPGRPAGKGYTLNCEEPVIAMVRSVIHSQIVGQASPQLQLGKYIAPPRRQTAAVIHEWRAARATQQTATVLHHASRTAWNRT